MRNTVTFISGAIVIVAFIYATAPRYSGIIITDLAYNDAIEIESIAIKAATRWKICGYGSSLPSVINIGEAEFITAPKRLTHVCAIADVNGNKITLNAKLPCPELDTVIAHEIGHLIGFDHVTDDDYCNFNRILASCGFKTISGPPECRSF